MFGHISDCHTRWTRMFGRKDARTRQMAWGLLDTVAHYAPRASTPKEADTIFFFGVLHELRWIRRGDRRVGIEEGMRRAKARSCDTVVRAGGTI